MSFFIDIRKVERAAEAFIFSLGLIVTPLSPEPEPPDNEPEAGEIETIKQTRTVDFDPRFTIASFTAVPSLESVGHTNGSNGVLAGMPTLNVKSLDTKNIQLSHALIEKHVHAALNVIMPSGDHEVHEKEELAEAFVKIVEAKGSIFGLSNEAVDKLRGHMCDAAGKWLKAERNL